MCFHDRATAGKQLAKKLTASLNGKILVLGLARGGIAVAFEVAKKLNAPLDTLVVRKLGAPSNPEFAFGAIAPKNTIFLNEKTIASLRLDKKVITKIAAREKIELVRHEKIYRGKRKFPRLTGKTIILVDDGIATGATTRAALQFLRNQDPTKIILATPIAATETLIWLQDSCDEIVYLHSPKFFGTVGAWYENFPQVNDSEVNAFLEKNWGDKSFR